MQRTMRMKKPGFARLFDLTRPPEKHTVFFG